MAKPSYIVAVAGDQHSPAANTAAVVTLAAAGAGIRHLVHEIHCAYSAAPTGGKLTVTDGGTVVFEQDIAEAHPLPFKFDPALAGAANSALVATLAAGGSGITGKVHIRRTKTAQ